MGSCSLVDLLSLDLLMVCPELFLLIRFSALVFAPARSIYICVCVLALDVTEDVFPFPLEVYLVFADFVTSHVRQIHKQEITYHSLAPLP